MHWAKALDCYTAWLAAGGASAGTIRLRVRYLRRLAQATDNSPWQLTLDHLTAFLAHPGWQPETRKSARASVVGFYGWAHLTGRIDHNPSALLPKVRVPAGQPRPAPDDVLDQAFLTADADVRLMLMLCCYAGLRRAEVAGAHSDDVSEECLRVKGKGGRVRSIWLHPLIRDELQGRPRGYLFPAQVGGFTNWRPDYTRHLSPDRVGRLIRAHLDGPWTCHTLRHRFATRGFSVERDVFTLQSLLGHSKPETTARYVLPPADAQRLAVLAAGPACA